jgi:hypothetical protein
VLTAQSAGTFDDPLQTQIATLTATLQGGDLYLVEADGLTVQEVSALAAGGDVAITSLTGNMLVRHLAADGLISLHAATGAILKTGAEPVTITAADLELQAAAGVGTSAAPLLTDVDRLEAAGGTGGVFIQNSGDLQIGGISASLLNLTGLSAANSNIAITASGSLSTVEAVQTTGAGTIGLSAAQGLTIGANVTTDSGPITLLANQGAVSTPGDFSGITLDGATISSQSGAILLAGRSGDSGADLAGIELRGGSAITTVNGQITLTGVSLGTGAGSDGVRVVEGSLINSSGTGNVTVTGTAGADGHGVLILNSSGIGATGTGNVLLAGTGGGGLADLAWDSLTIQKTGGTYTFQDTVQGGQLFVLPGNYQVVFLDGGSIAGAVVFQNTGGVVLGNADSDALTFAGGLTSTPAQRRSRHTRRRTGTSAAQ